MLEEAAEICFLVEFASYNTSPWTLSVGEIGNGEFCLCLASDSKTESAAF